MEFKLVRRYGLHPYLGVGQVRQEAPFCPLSQGLEVSPFLYFHESSVHVQFEVAIEPGFRITRCDDNRVFMVELHAIMLLQDVGIGLQEFS